MPSTSLLILIAGPIAAGKSTIAREVSARARAAGLSVALVDLDTIAEMALPSLPVWDWAHAIHARVVGHWLATGIDLVIDEGASSPDEMRQILDHVPEGTAVLHVVLTAEFEPSLARAQADLDRGISRDREFLRADHERFRAGLEDLPCDLRIHVEGRKPGEMAEEILDAFEAALAVPRGEALIARV